MTAASAPGSPESPGRPRAEQLQERFGPRYKWVVLATVLSGLFAVAFSFTILSVQLAVLAEQFGTTQATTIWVVSGGVFVYGVFGPIMGKLSDVYGARRVYLFGFGAETVMFALSAFAWSIESLIAFRVIASFLGAVAAPATVKFIATVFEPDERSKALGWFSTVSAWSPSIGLVVGAVILAIAPAIGWRIVFALQAPMCLAALLVGAWVLPETDRRTGTRIDVAGGLLLAAGLFCALYSVNRLASWGLDDPRIWVLILLVPMFLGLFVVRERRAPEPLFPIDYFRRRNFSVGVAVAFLANFAYLGSFVLAPFLLDEVFGLGEDEGGQVAALLLIRPVFFGIMGIVAGYMIGRTGVRSAAFAGAVVMTVSLLLFASVDASSSLVIVAVALALQGTGFGPVNTGANTAVVNSIAVEDQGVGGGVVASATAVGAAAGPVVMNSIKEAAESGATDVSDAFSLAYLAGAACLAVTAGLTLLLRSRPSQAVEGLAGAVPAEVPAD